MNDVHDMGGMHGLGPIEREEDEPVFHDTWEGRVLGIHVAMTPAPGWNIDYSRYMRECLPAHAYLEKSYYEQWLYMRTVMLLEAGLISAEELRTGRVAPGSPRRNDAKTAEQVWSVIRTGYDAGRETEEPPKYSVGQPVRTRNSQPPGHTRLPRYARAKLGTIYAHRGAHVFPDTNAHGLGENPQHLYNVAIPARELWGAEAAPKDKVHLDLWESYLEPA